jgi:hypothetical protein
MFSFDLFLLRLWFCCFSSGLYFIFCGAVVLLSFIFVCCFACFFFLGVARSFLILGSFLYLVTQSLSYLFLTGCRLDSFVSFP